MCGPRIEAVAVRESSARTDAPAVSLRAAVLDGEDGKISARGIAATPLVSSLASAPLSPVVVGRMRPDAPPTVIVQGPEETIEAIRPARDGSVQRLWRVAGRATTSNNFYG